MKRPYTYLLLAVLVMLPALACGFSSDGPPRNAVVVEVVANTSLTPWLESAVATFNEQEAEVEEGRPVYVELSATDAGQAVTEITGGATPDLWIPDHEVWVHLLANEGVDSYQNDCAVVAQSPLVIAMWRPLAESLGWPGRDLGWLDVGSLAADPGAWEYYSGGQFGDTLRLGHTHPGLSATGASTLLALVQAAESQTEAVSVEEVQQPIVQASIGAFEGAVAWFSSDTATLAQTMRERGVQFLGAAVIYESDVVQYGGGDPEIVPIYPFEGTFVAQHAACANGDGDAEAAAVFRDYLRSEEAQALAVEAGLRPVNDEVSAGAPLDETGGVDLSQPEVTFASPTVDTLFAVQDVWQSARKDVNLVMLLDVSGSMAGEKIENVRRAAVQFVEQMGDDDYISIIAFSSEPMPIVGHRPIAGNREKIAAAIEGLEAEGDTTLYDAIGDGATLLSETTSSETANAMVVLSDGLDTGSFRYDPAGATAAVVDTGATVFTIAYGSDADEALMEEIAVQANGNFFRGDEASIAAIYQEMSAAFGGSVGVGR
ncbi:MAG: substrate-binding domain-containing protein [Candidatus Promineifilaceae bacterium]|nr:substrate-binding domain-containing protein [Candidatus Promineifilaceae bacterium]